MDTVLNAISVFEQCEQLHAILYKPFLIGLGIGLGICQCERSVRPDLNKQMCTVG